MTVIEIHFAQTAYYRAVCLRFMILVFAKFLYF